MGSATAVRERPILFSGEMVRAILDGRKTQTRRVIVPQPEPFTVHDDPSEFWWFRSRMKGLENRGRILRRDLPSALLPHHPFGQPGDRLWVRETWALEDCGRDGERITWRADRRAAWRATLPAYFYTRCDFEPDRWRPSIHMPRWASRLSLEVTGVRVERVQEITEEDARAEGVTAPWIGHDRWDYRGPRTHREAFARLWDRLNAPRGYGWDANPWVWIVSFRRTEASS